MSIPLLQNVIINPTCGPLVSTQPISKRPPPPPGASLASLLQISGMQRLLFSKLLLTSWSRAHRYQWLRRLSGQAENGLSSGKGESEMAGTGGFPRLLAIWLSLACDSSSSEEEEASGRRVPKPGCSFSLSCPPSLPSFLPSTLLYSRDQTRGLLRVRQGKCSSTETHHQLLK